MQYYIRLYSQPFLYFDHNRCILFWLFNKTDQLLLCCWLGKHLKRLSQFMMVLVVWTFNFYAHVCMPSQGELFASLSQWTQDINGGNGLKKASFWKGILSIFKMYLFFGSQQHVTLCRARMVCNIITLNHFWHVTRSISTKSIALNTTNYSKLHMAQTNVQQHKVVMHNWNNQQATKDYEKIK